jgi:hypothetical protein
LYFPEKKTKHLDQDEIIEILDVDDLSESSSTYDMIIVEGRDLLGQSGIIMKFNDHKVTWDSDTISMKDRDTALYYQYGP